MNLSKDSILHARPITDFVWRGFRGAQGERTPSTRRPP